MGDDDEEEIPDWKKPEPPDLSGFASGDKIQAALDDERAYKFAAPGSEEKVYDGIPLLDAAARLKEQANAHVKQKRANEAVKLYKEGLGVLDRCKGKPMLPEEQLRIDAMAAQLQGNLAQCMLGLELYRRAIDAATECLRLDASNVKALYRRSLAFEKLQEWDEALRDSVHLRKLGGGSLNPNELEKRCEALLEKQMAENKAVNEVGKANEEVFKMKERFDAVMEKYHFDDGEAAPVVAGWLVDVDNGGLTSTVEKMQKRWQMTKQDAEDFAKWIRKGIEMNVIPNPKGKATANPFSKHV